MSNYQLTGAVGPDVVKTTRDVREAVERAYNNTGRASGLPPLQVVTVDHYNTKWAVVAIEWLRRKRIVDHILRRPRRVCIEVLEGGMLPRGRFGFYNGVGGALADMIAHLIQPLRALTGHASVKDLLSALRIVEVRRARYDIDSQLVLNAFGTGKVSKPDLASKLAKDTETFGVIHLQFIGPPWNDTPVFIRTGKGILPTSKTIVVEGFDDDGPVALICDIDKRHIRLAATGTSLEPLSQPGQNIKPQTSGSFGSMPDHIWMQTQEIDVPGLLSSRPLSTKASEYVEVFSALCDWESADPRYFPPVEEAAYACGFFYQALIRNRAAYPQGLHGPDCVYQADYAGEEVRKWLADQAGWQ